MKVLDLHCVHVHVFEGWFASEADFISQLERGLVTCPVCGDAEITKRLSAPRLNLGAARDSTPALLQTSESAVVPGSAAGGTGGEQEAGTASPSGRSLRAGEDAKLLAMQAAWLTAAREVMVNTDDVGTQFAEEARKMHYGETKERGIRGQATREEAESLLDEGIAVVPMLLPDALKGQMQ